MEFIKRLLIGAVVLGCFAAFLISQGKWQSAVVDPVTEVFGGDTARAVDTFGQRSNDVTGKVLELGGKMIDGYFAADGTVDPGAVREALGQRGHVDNIRIPDYDRKEFGTPWADVDGNGCDTRNDILARDLTKVTKKSDNCTVLTGTLSNDPYTGKKIDFVRGPKTSSQIHIDHIFSLSQAWRGGAHAWSGQQRLAFANDPDNLLAVDGPTNSSKSDKGPAEWLPGNDNYRCTYIAKYVQVSTKYELRVDDRDREAMNKALSTC